MSILSTPAQLEKSDFARECALADKIPYAYLLDAETVETKSGHLIQVIQLEGLLAETLNDLELDQEKTLRNSLFKSISDSSTALYFHTMRSKEQRLLSGSSQEGFARRLNAKWQGKFQEKNLFINTHYITVVKKPPVGKIRRLSDWFSALSATVNQQARAAYRKSVHQDLNKITKRIISHLSHYQARKLGVQKGAADRSELLSFLFELINLEKRSLACIPCDLAQYLPAKRLFFDKTTGVMALRGIDNQVAYAALLSIRDYDRSSWAGMLDPLLNVKAEILITQSFSFLDKVDAKAKIKEQQRNQAQSDNHSLSEHDRMEQTLDELGSSSATMGEHHFTVLCKAGSIAALEKSIAEIDATLNEMGILAIREDVGIKPAYFANLPGNQAYIARRALLSSKNMASFASVHNYAGGQFSGNYWGEAVTILETISGTPYYFNFHVLDVANTFLIGPMGCGKTLLEGFLLAQSMKYGGRLFVFDKDRGLEIFVRAMQGSYAVMTAGERTGFAPFQMEDSPETRYFLLRLLEKMATSDQKMLGDDDHLRMQAAIAGAFQLPKAQRVLRNIVPFLGVCKAGSLRARLEPWINAGAYAWVFDNAEDHLSLDSRILGFDMSAALSDDHVRAAIYFYLFHRIEQKLDGTKTRIVVAEGWKALQDDAFRQQIQDWSSTPRKKEAFLVMDTQAPEDIAQSAIGCKIIQETVTQIYFANPAARRSDYVDQFGLTERELQIVQTLDKSARYFLLKQGKRSVVVRADLSGFDDEIAILSGRTKHIKILERIRKEQGEDPAVWMPVFLQAIRSGL